MNESLREKLKNLPNSPGVYFHKGKSGEVIYVGKAAVLKNRVRQYFQSKKDMDLKTLALVEEIFDTDWIEVETELDALFLESEMVKRYMPKFNILLRDDKSHSYIRIGMNDKVPYVSLTRNPLDDGATYFGPYFAMYSIKKALRYLRKIFPYYEKPYDSKKLDLNYHIGLTPGIETGRTTIDEYRRNLRKMMRYIQGERKSIIRELEKDMSVYSESMQFERAAEVRNQYLNLKELQRIIVFGDKEFLDISKDKALSDLSNLLGLEKIPVKIEGYDIAHMSGESVVASMVVFKNGVSSRADYRKFKIKIDRNDDFANLREVLVRRFSEKNIKAWGVPDLILIDGGKGQLGVAVDVAKETGLKIPVVSLAKRDEELIVHKTMSNINLDRINKLRSDGGVEILESGDYLTLNLHLGQIHSSGHAKNLRGDTVSRFSDVVKLFQRIRDESHRFAVSYHTALRRKTQTRSALDDIPGIGPKTKAILKKRVGSVAKIRSMNESELAGIIGKNRAKIVKNWIK